MGLEPPDDYSDDPEELHPDKYLPDLELAIEDGVSGARDGLRVFLRKAFMAGHSRQMNFEQFLEREGAPWMANMPYAKT